MSGASMPDGDCVQLNNLVCGEHGLRSRLGEREWCTGLTGGLDNEVRTLLPIAGSAASGDLAKLFACTSTGIWDVTDSTAAPTQVVTFPVQTGEAGRGVAHGMTTSAGHFLAYCDEENGYHLFTESTGLWTVPIAGSNPGEIDGVNPALFCFVTVWKSRLWFVERNSSRAWYLAAGAIAGTATLLNLDRAAQFRAGGELVGLWNWTLDGGSGIDDLLVAMSRGGDVAVYQGTDPASANTFALKGTWSVGALPAGRNVANAFGGDILIISKSGLRPLSQLVSGVDGAGTYAPSKVANLFNDLMRTRSELPGWALHIHPEDNSLMVLVPTDSGEPTEQLAQQLWNRSWSRYQDLPIFSACVWDKQLYFGTTDGRVCINTGFVDGVTLADPDAYSVVQWSLLTRFNNMGSPRQKQVQLLRPLILSETGAPTFEIQARYKYDLSPIADVTEAAASGEAWDAALWDAAVWAGDYSAAQPVRGATGMGTDVAIAMRGTAKSRTVVVSIDVVFTQGGVL